jgi:hypothetical protein
MKLISKNASVPPVFLQCGQITVVMPRGQFTVILPLHYFFVSLNNFSQASVCF